MVAVVVSVEAVEDALLSVDNVTEVVLSEDVKDTPGNVEMVTAVVPSLENIEDALFPVSHATEVILSLGDVEDSAASVDSVI